MKTRYKVLIVLAIVLVVLVAAGFAALVILSMDEPPPDDTDLRVQRLEIADEENAFTYINQAAQVLYLPGYEPESEDVDAEDHEERHDSESDEQLCEKRELLDRMVEGEAWDDALANEVLRKNEQTFALFEKGLACPHFQVPESRSIEDLLPDVFYWLQTGRLLVIRSRHLFVEGRERKAFDEAFKLVQFGHNMQCAKGSIVHYLLGKMVKEMGLKTMRQMLPDAVLEADALKALVHLLAEFSADEQGVADVFRVEYGVDVQLVDDVKTGKYSLEEIAAGAPARLRVTAPPFFFHPNETKRLFVRAFRPMVESAPLSFAEMQPKLRSIPAPYTGPRWRICLGGNAVGTRLYGMMVPATKGFLEQKCRENTEVAATRVLLAMKAFRVEKSRLPETLDELVPEYLDAVPLDDYDGKPLRYSAEKKVIYSVGKDLKDGGGMTKEEQKAWWKEENPGCEEDVEPEIWQLPDPSFPIEF